MKRVLIVLGMLVCGHQANAGDIVNWPMDKQAHFLAGYGLGISGSLVGERLGAGRLVSGLLGTALAGVAGLLKERSDAVYDAEDVRKTLYGGVCGSVFYWTIRF